MEVNALPTFDVSDNPTGCCPRFDPTGWDQQTLHFAAKPFVRARTHSIAHFPLDMGRVFRRTFEAIHDAGAQRDDDVIVMSHDRSAWSAEHFFSVDRDVDGQDMVYLDGEFYTRVFEGPYRNVPKWGEALRAEVEAAGKTVRDIFFFYTTCPKCAKHYGRNYVVGLAQTG